MYVLDPARVTPLVAPDGAVYYQLKKDQMAPLEEASIVVPARDIIHDPMYTIYHPLVGLPPLHAGGLAATLGLAIQSNSTNFFGNSSQPGGILIAPKGINQAQADEMQARWGTSFSGANRGKVAVLGGELSYHQIAETATNAQLIEQWEATSKSIASTFHVPWHLVGGPPPPYNNIQALTVQYYTQCIQALSTQIEYSLDRGLRLNRPYGTMFNIDDLLWMDTATAVTTLKEGVGGGLMKPNEARQRLNLPPVEGGDDVYSQQQNWSLAALSRRDEMALNPPPTPTTLPQADEDEASRTCPRTRPRKCWGSYSRKRWPHDRE